MADDPDLAMILADMRSEFIEGTNDRLDEADRAITDLLEGRGDWNNNLLEVKRIVHSIKGGGTTFGFPTVSMIAHALEDYLETAGAIERGEIEDAQFFIDRMREILDMGGNPDDETAAKLLEGLPTKKRRGAKVQTQSIGNVLLLMPKGLQRKIIGQELTSFGFRVSIAENVLSAIDRALALKPDLVVASMVLDRMSGADLAGIFGAVKALRKTKVLLVTAYDLDDHVLDEIPSNAKVIHKGMTFARDFMEFLREEGLTGKKRN